MIVVIYNRKFQNTTKKGQKVGAARKMKYPALEFMKMFLEWEDINQETIQSSIAEKDKYVNYMIKLTGANSLKDKTVRYVHTSPDLVLFFSKMGEYSRTQSVLSSRAFVGCARKKQNFHF